MFAMAHFSIRLSDSASLLTLLFSHGPATHPVWLLYLLLNEK